MEAPLLKDLTNLGAEDNATAAGFHEVYRRATSGAIKVFTSSVNIPGTRFEFDNLFGCRLVISEVDPTNDLAGLQEQGSQLKAKMPSRGLPRCFPAATQATILTGDTPEAVSDPLPL